MRPGARIPWRVPVAQGFACSGCGERVDVARAPEGIVFIDPATRRRHVCRERES